MAYPTVSAPYGFRPINRLDGAPYAGATRTYKIASTYNTPIYNGDLVKIVTGGTIEKFTTAQSGSPCGVFMGCSYTSSQGQPLNAQYYPGTSVTNAAAVVVVDPTALFQVVATTSGSAVSSGSLASIGSNMELVSGAGNANTGDSGQSVLAGSETDTAAFPIRVVDVVYATATGSDTFPELIVKINLNQFNNTTGV